MDADGSEIDDGLKAPGQEPVLASTPKQCLNCGAGKQGEYCHGCGQSFGVSRITLASLASEISSWMSLQRGLLRTLKEMTIRPGVMIDNYLRGQRRSYVNPVTYIVFVSGLSLLAYQLYKDKISRLSQERLSTIPVGESPLLSAEQTQAYVEIMIRVTQQTSWTAILLAIPFALLIRVFFGRSGINFPEAVAFSLFTLGQAVLLHLLLITPTLLLTNQWQHAGWITFLPYLFAAAFAAAGLFKSPVRSALKAMVALAFSFLFYGIVISVGILVYVINFR